MAATELPDGTEPSNAGLVRTISRSWSSLVKKKPPSASSQKDSSIRSVSRSAHSRCSRGRRFEDIEERDTEHGVVVEIAVQLGDAVLPGVEQPIAGPQPASNERRAAHGDSSILRLSRDPQRVGVGRDHQAVPGGEDLLVAARLDALLASREQLARAHRRAAGGSRRGLAEHLGELLVARA